MLSFSPLLGLNLPVLGTRSSLITSSGLRLSRESRVPLVRLTQIEPLAISPLIRTSKLLSARTEQPEIGWDNWNPLNQTIDRDSLNENRIEDRIDRLDNIADRNLDSFKTILTPEPVINDSPESLVQQSDNNSSISQDDLTITTSPRGKRAKSQRKSKSSHPIQKSPDLAKIDRQKSKKISPETTTDIHPSATPQLSPKIAVAQISTSADEIEPDLEPTRRLNSNTLALNSLDDPTTINPPLPSTSFPTISLESSNESIINIPESLNILPPDIFPSTTQPSSALEQISTSSDKIASGIEPTYRLNSDTLALNPLDDPTTINPPLPLTSPSFEQISNELATNKTTIPKVPNTLPPDIYPSTAQPSSTLEQISRSSDEIAPDIEPTHRLNSDTLALNSLDDILPNISLSTARPSSALEQISSSSDEIAPDLEPTRRLNADTLALNSLDDPTTINPPLPSTSSPAISLESSNESTNKTTIPEALNTLPPDIYPPTAQPSSALEQISSLSGEIAPDIEPTRRLNSDDIRLSSETSLLEKILLPSDGIGAKKVSIDRFGDESIQENLPLNSIPHQTIDNDFLDVKLHNLEELSTDIDDNSDRIVGSTNHPPLQSGVSEPTIYKEQDSSLPQIDNQADLTIPASVVGYATGGSVRESNQVDLQSIATSDTVSAMLTPGEFIVNAKDAQKNLDLLTHINTGGEPESVLAKTIPEQQIVEPSLNKITSTENFSNSFQRKSHDLLISPSLQRNPDLHQISFLNKPPIAPTQLSQIETNKTSNNYTSPPLIFRKSNLSSRIDNARLDPPDEWSDIEELINGNSNNSDTFSFNSLDNFDGDGDRSDRYHRVESRSSPLVAPKYISPVRGFANGGEVTPSALSKPIEPTTQTIEVPAFNAQEQGESNDPAELEILAREIYHRLRQRLEIERERQGSYAGNLAW